MEALYIKVKNDLLEKITSGQYPNGHTIPTEHQLSAIYKVSRPTIRQAVQLLVDDGYLEKRKKRGTMVCKPKIEQGFTQFIASFDSQMNLQGLETKTTVLGFKKEKVTEDIMNNLHLKATDEVYRLVRLRFVDNQPNVLVTSYVPVKFFPNLLEVDFTSNRLYDVFENSGHPISLLTRKLETFKADETIADLLEIQCGDPMFFFKSVGYDESHIPIEYSISKYRGDNNSFVMELSLKK